MSDGTAGLVGADSERETLTPPGLRVSTPTGAHPNHDHDISPWIDEQIWGHRLWDAQSPWLVFLEFLTVAEARNREGALLNDFGAYPLTFRPQQRLYLRNILFNSDDVMRFAEQQPDSRTAWEAWLARMAERAQAVPVRDFSYLRERFHSFDEFARLVSLLRTAVVEQQSNKRWTSRYLFPFGRDAIYEDLNFKGSREYIYFGRTGELLYLMLCRANSRDALRPIVSRMVAEDGRWNRLVALLQPDDGRGDQQMRGRSYLPYESHPVFDALAEDWISISSLQLPGYDAYPHYVTLAGLHLLRYHMAVAEAWAVASSAGEGDRLNMVCEVVAPRKTLIRELSLASYARNDGLSSRAIEQVVTRIGASKGWKRANSGSGAFLQCREYLQQTVWWGKDYDGPNDADALLAALRAKALKGHRDHVGQFHRVMGREIGLVSRRGTTRFRYAPTDELIRTLLFANVERRMEFNEFLARLFERYSLVIGDREAERVLRPEDFDKKAFQANAKRVEERLSSLGLLRRLSDACAYVVNPYAGSAARLDKPPVSAFDHPSAAVLEDLR
ncbi:MAG TPA: hypothetical protein VJU82_15185 [Acidobacteriaceae bacterium]|nr:hypothetical protein [Acidobacteriaceae bacterium]